MRKNILTTSIKFGALTALTFGLGACSNAKEQLGLNKTSPDEFMVVKHAPLAMPPDYSLTPPSPGAPRPQEQAMSQAAKTAVLGESTPNTGGASPEEALLLQQAGSTNPNPNIRAIVDQESAELAENEKSVANKLVGWGGDAPAASIVNAKEETQRLQKNAAEGKPVTAGKTPTIEQ